MNELRFVKTIIDYPDETFTATLLDGKRQLMVYQDSLDERFARIALKTVHNLMFDSGEEIKFEDIDYFLVKFAFFNKQTMNLEKLMGYRLFAVIEGEKKLIDEDYSLSEMRKKAKSCAQITKTGVKTFLSSRNLDSYEFDGQPWEVLHMPYMVALNEPGKYREERILQLAEYEDISVERHFVDNSVTHTISFKQPLIYSSGPISKIYLNASFITSIAFFGILFGAHFMANVRLVLGDDGLIVVMIALIILTFLFYYLFFTFVLKEKITLEINDKYIVCNSDSILTKTSNYMVTSELDELVVDGLEPLAFTGVGLEVPKPGCNDRAYFIGKKGMFWLNLWRKHADSVHFAINEALMRAGEKYLLDNEDSMERKLGVG